MHIQTHTEQWLGQGVRRLPAQRAIMTDPTHCNERLLIRLLNKLMMTHINIALLNRWYLRMMCSVSTHMLEKLSFGAYSSTESTQLYLSCTLNQESFIRRHLQHALALSCSLLFGSFRLYSQTRGLVQTVKHVCTDSSFIRVSLSFWSVVPLVFKLMEVIVWNHQCENTLDDWAKNHISILKLQTQWSVLSLQSLAPLPQSRWLSPKFFRSLTYQMADGFKPVCWEVY